MISKRKLIEGLNLLSLITMISFFFIPYLSQYRRVIIYYPLVLVWITSAMKLDKTWLKKAYKSYFYLYILLLLSLVITLTSGSYTELSRFFFYTFMTFMWQFVFVFYRYNFRLIENKIHVFIIMSLIGTISTLVGLINYPHASRDLATGAHMLVEEKLMYQQMGIGGYSFIYGLVFLIPALYVSVRRSSRKIDKLFIILVLLLSVVTVILSSYSIAIGLMIVMLIFAHFLSSKSKYRVVSIIWLILLLFFTFLFRYSIIKFAANMASDFDLLLVSQRLNEIYNAMRYDQFLNLERSKLYINGMLNFFDRPFWGVDVSNDLLRKSGHSEIIYYFERYGFFGSSYLLFILNGFKQTRTVIKDNYLKNALLIFQIALFSFALLNRFDTAYSAGFVIFCLIPLMFMRLEKY